MTNRCTAPDLSCNLQQNSGPHSGPLHNIKIEPRGFNFKFYIFYFCNSMTSHTKLHNKNHIMLFGISSGKNTRATRQATYRGFPMRESVAMNHSEGSPSTSSEHSEQSVSATQALSVSIQNSLVGDSESTSAFHAKQDTSILPQSGLELDQITQISDLFKNLAERGNLPIDDKLLVEIEGLVALLITLQGCENFTSTTAAIILYVRKYVDSSITSQIIAYISETFEPQTGTETPDHPRWIQLMRSVRDDWSLCKGNKLFSHFSKILGLLVTLGLCQASSLTFSINDFKLFEPDLKMLHLSASDLADAAFGTVTFFVESMYMCIKQKSLRPFLLGDHSAVEMDEEYSRIIMWWDLVKTGNLMRVANVQESIFDKRLETLTTRLRNLMGGKSSFEKKILQDKYTKLLTIRNDYTTMKISSGVRKAPFAIQLFGESSQGKTTLGDQLVDAMLRSADLPLGKEFRASYNPADKFMSTWSTDKEVMFIDDMANDKSQFVERPPTRVVIDVCNNQPYYANMAEIDRKGKVFVEPSIVVVNTNVKDLDARTYSNCPYSIQRRMDVVITVQAKPEFQYVVDGIPQGIDSEKIRAFYDAAGETPVFDDIWSLTLEKAEKPAKLNLSAGYKPIVHNGKSMANISFRTVVQYLIDRFHSHRISQDDIIQRMNSRTKDIKICGVDNCVQMKGYCDKHDHLSEQFGEELASGVETACKYVTGKLSNEVSVFGKAIEGAGSLALLAGAKYFVRRWNWLMILPTPAIMDDNCLKYMAFINKDRLKNRYLMYTCIMWSLFLSFCWFAPFWCIVPVLLVLLYVQKMMFSLIMVDFRYRLLQANSIAPCIQNIRDEYASYVLGACGVVGVLYTVGKIYTRWCAYGKQGSLEPKTPEDVKERDDETNPWSEISIRPVPIADTGRCSTFEQLTSVVQKNLVYGSVVIKDQHVLMVNGLFIRSNLVLIPSHYFVQDVLDVTFRKIKPDTVGGKFAVRLSKSASYHVPNTDFCICYASSGGSFKDLTKHFPVENFPLHEFSMFWRAKNGEITEMKGVAHPKQTANGVCQFTGGEYGNLSHDTFKGLCGAVLVSHGKVNNITGIHLGGKAGTKRGCYGFLSQSQIEEAVIHLRKCEGTLLTGTAENFEKQVLGVTVINSKPLHAKSPMRYLPADSQLEYLGSCPGATTAISNVAVLPISETVMHVTGQPNIWGPPKMNPQWFGWQNCLANLSNPAMPYPHDLLALAVQDYKEPLLETFRSPMWCGATPLSDHDNLCGQPGVRFMDAIKLDTSVGYPLSGPKRRFVTELEPTEDKPNNRVLDEFIMDEITRCENCYKRGERAYTIAKACKKDEVLAKEKCRIFYGNPIALTFLVRKYFLPLIRVLQMNPLTAECAVGINAEGPEWEEFHQFVLKHGKDRIIGGDYGKYDQKLPSQLLIASLRILIDCARVCNYSEGDLTIMEAMTGDLVFAIIAFNGDLVGLTEGTHISGNSLTVILNGICGSLNLRAFFYTQYPSATFEQRKAFRKYVNLMTYGDDNIGSVDSSIDKFTIKGASEFLKSYGQIYTMPDKESELIDFLPYEDFEFLKRKSIYKPELKVHTGALLTKSVFKSLHCHLKKKNDLTDTMLSALNIDGALRDWFHQGESEYELRRSQMMVVAARCDITHLCTGLDTTYAERVEDWKLKYVKGYEAQSGVEDLYQKAKKEIPLKIIGCDIPILNSAIGEVDCIYQTTYKGVCHILIVEIKSTYGTDHTRNAAYRKGRKQLTTTCNGLAIINPHISYNGVLLNPLGYEPVIQTGLEGCWEDMDLPW